MLFALYISTTILLIAYIYKLKNKIQNINLKLKKQKCELEDALLKQSHINMQKSDTVCQLIGGLAHQWKQPLSQISATCCHLSLKATLCDKLDKEIYSTGLSNISDSTIHLSQTIDIFRDYVKGERIYKKLSLYDEIKQATVVSSVTLKQHHIDIVDNMNFDTPIYIYAVVGEFSQAIINIINNAKDAILDNNPENPKVIYNLKREKHKVIFTIQDNGGGIEEDTISKIFEPYYTTKDKSSGTGLGLNISKKIITEDLQGKIYVKNIDNGAKFFIELPLL